MHAYDSYLSVVTFNTLGTPFMRGHQKKNYLALTYYLKKRFAKLSQLLNESDADILALQEVHLYPLLFLLKKKLTNYPYHYYKPFIYGPRGGMVTFSKYPLTDCHYIDFKKHGSFKDKSFIFKITQNGILVVRIKDKPVYVLNITVSADADHDWTRDSKYNSLHISQLSQIISVINTFSAMKATIFAVGDFNIKQHSALYNDFCSRTDVKDLFAQYEIPTQHPDFLPKNLKDIPRLDYVFIKSPHDLEHIETKHLFREKVHLGKKELFLSDHVGLLAKVAV